MAKSNSWTSGSASGKNAPDLVFDGGSSGTLSLELIFDTTSDGSAVTTHTNKLTALMSVDTQLADWGGEPASGPTDYLVLDG